MSSWVGAFVETCGRADVADVLALHHVEAEHTPAGDWLYVTAEVSLASLVPPAFAQALSEELGGRVIAFFLQSTASVEEIVCFDAGESVRHLGYEPDVGWHVHEGTAQDWEPSYFFADGEGTKAGEVWPFSLFDDLDEADQGRYEAARQAGDAESALDLFHVGSGHGLMRLCAHFGVKHNAPHATYRPPANARLRWKLYAGIAATVLFFVFMFWLGAT